MATDVKGEKPMRDLKLPEQRHPEKAHKPDNAQPKKPDWIRVKAPTSEGYKEVPTWYKHAETEQIGPLTPSLPT